MLNSAFSEDEFRRRFDRAREALRAAGLPGAICVSPESLYYLSGYNAHTHFSSQALIIGTDDPEPTLLIRDCDVTHAPDSSWVGDVRTYHFGRDDVAWLVARAVTDRIPGAGRIGLELAAYALPASYGLAIIDAVAPRRVEDCSDLLGRLRVVKSEAELKLMREAARIASVGLKAFAENLRPGITEIALAGEIEAAMRATGGDYPAMPTWMQGGPRYNLGHGTPVDRVIEQSELIGIEHAGVAHRYHAALMQIASVGPPAPEALRHNEIGVEAMAAGVAAARPGAPAGEMEQAAYDVVRRRGGDADGLMRFGYGIGIAYPPSWLEPFHVIAESREPLQPGMTMMLHVSGIGGTYEMTNDGLKLLCGSQELLVV